MPSAYRDSELWTAVAILLGCVVGFSFLGAILVVETQTKSVCLQRGYPGSSVTWNFHRYCIKRVDQTDVVVPLEEAIR